MSAQTGVRTRAGAATSVVTWSLVALAIVIAALIRLRLLNVPFERDEGEYAYAGQLILSGVPPYTLLYNMKLPGTYLAYAASMLLFGQTIAGARLGLILATSATGIGVYLLGKRFARRRYAVAGAAAYAVLALSTEMLGPFGHATHYVALFAVWGLVVLSAALERNHLLLSFAAGLLLGLAILMKQPGGVFLGCAAVWIVTGESGRRLRHSVAIFAGVGVIFGGLTLWLALSGALGAFWLWVVRYGPAYASLLTISDGWENLRVHLFWIVTQAPVVWLLVASGLALLFTRRVSGQLRTRLGALAGFSFLGVCPGFYFREHYFLILVPAAALLVTLTVREIATMARWTPWLAAALVVFGFCQALYDQREVLLEGSPDEVSRLVYGPNLFVESVRIGSYIRDRSRPDDRVFVLGSEPEILFYARKKSATGVVYMYPLLESQRLAREMGEILISEVEQQRPAYAVLIGNPESWNEAPKPRPRFLDWAPRYLSANYVVVGQVITQAAGTSQYLWDSAAARFPLGEATKALVMLRRDLAAAP